ncbi:replication initiation protein, partial [Staphylococcus aureus]
DKLKNIASIDLTDLMKISLRGNENQLQKQIVFWLN